MKKTLIGTLLMLIGSMAVRAQVTELPWTEGFESGFAAWTLVDADGDNYNWKLGYDEYAEQPHSGTAFIYSESYDENTGQDLTPDNYIFSPAIAIPDDASGIWAEYYVACLNGAWPAEHLSVYVATAATVESLEGVVPVEEYTLTQSDHYMPFYGGHTHHNFCLDAYAGQTVHIVFRHHNCTGNSYVIIDDVSVVQTYEPQVSIDGPTALMRGDTAVFAANISSGALSTMVYSWSSTMVSAGQAVISATADTASIVYTAGGIDTVVVTATNVHGSATAQRVVTVVDCGAPITLPWSLDLYANDPLQCWTAAGAGTWARGGSGLTPRYLGSSEADDWVITPPIAMPPIAQGVELSWLVRGHSGCTYEVRVSPTGDTAMASFTDSIFGESYTSSTFTERTASLEGYGAMTIRLAFRHVAGGGSLRLRNVAISQPAVPIFSIAGPASVDVGEDTTFSIVMSSGWESGTTYSWSSTMAADGLATISGTTDSTISISYNAAGIDTLTASATNSVGTTTLSRTVYARQCTTVTSFPYTLNLATQYDMVCWQTIDADGNGECWSRSQNGSYLSGPLSFYGTDDWLISPQMAIPDESGFLLAWQVYGNHWDIRDVYYEVLVSPSGADSLGAFTDTLLAESYGTSAWAVRRASLDAYRGQTVRVAFRHVIENSDDGMRLRDICVRQANEPVIDIVGTTLAEAGTEVTLAGQMLEGTAEGTTWTWNSTMANNGQASLNADDDTIVIVYYAGGTDTVSLTATNAYGSDSATHIVVVNDMVPVGSFPYSTTFDSTATDNGLWRMAGGTNNRWTIGSATGHGDSASLYVSSSQGLDNSYSPSHYTNAYAYRVLDIAEPGDYQVSYDWRGMGETNYDYMRVFMAPSSFNPQNNADIAGLNHLNLPEGWLALDGGAQLQGDSTWQHIDVEASVPTADRWRLVFYWHNDYNTGTNPPAAVDNIFVKVVSCHAPAGLTVDSVATNMAVVSWTPVGDEQQWAVYLDGEEYQIESTPECVIGGLDSLTTYTVSVRAVCNPGVDTSIASFVTLTTVGDTAEPVVCLAPTDLAAESTDSTVSMSWNGDAGSYEVAIIDGEVWDDAAAGQTTDSTVFTFGGLAASTTYTVGVRTVCDTLRSEWVTTTIATAEAYVPPTPAECIAPSDLTATAVTSTTATVVWTPGGEETAWELQLDNGQELVSKSEAKRA